MFYLLQMFFSFSFPFSLYADALALAMPKLRWLSRVLRMRMGK